MAAAILPLHVPRIVREPDALGWLVIYRSFGWSYGSRIEALAAWHELAQDMQP